MKLLTKEQQESYENAKICYIYKEKFEKKYLEDKKYRNVRDHCYYTGKNRGAAHSICNLKYSVPKKNSVNFQKESVEEFKKQFTCLKENTEKYTTITVPIYKEFTRIDKKEEKFTKTMN